MDINVADLRQMYSNSVVLHKNKPVYIDHITEDGKFHILDILTQKSRIVTFKQEDFQAPTRRLGMINVKGSVVYGSRLPVRKFKIGLSNENTSFKHIEGVRYPVGRAVTLEWIQSLYRREIGEALFNKYPTLKEAKEFVEANGGACAFDKQFALGEGGIVFYKTGAVGCLPHGKSNPSDIVFNKSREHLNILLDGKYEQITRSS